MRDLFVPDGRYFVSRGAPSYHLWAPNIAAVVLAQRETVQEKVGQAEALLRSSRAFLYATGCSLRANPSQST